MVKTVANIDAAEILRMIVRIRRHLARKNKKWHDAIILVAVGRFKTVNMSEVADWTGLAFAVTSRIVSRFEKAGLVKKNRDLNDSRVVNISLTKEGQDEYEMLERLLKSIVL